MKMNIRKYWARMLAAGILLLGAASCVDEDSRFSGGGEGPDSGNVGYLSFAELTVKIEDRMEEVNQAPEARAATRAGNTDLDTYEVEILDASGSAVEIAGKNGDTVKSFPYGERPEQIELPVGSYTLSVRSGDTPATAWEGDDDTPTYGADAKFAITKGNTTALTDVTCRLLTVQVSVAYKDTLIATMSEQTTAKLVLGEQNALTFEGREPAKAGFLKPEAGQKNPLVLYLTTTFNGKEIKEQRLTVAEDAKAGEWRKITVGLQHAEDGTVVINAEIETWVYNEEVVVDTRSLALFSEERIPDENDPDAPKLEWPGHPLDETFKLTPDNFDDEGYFNESCDFTVTTKDPMASFEISVTTTNTAFEATLRAAELTQPVDMFTLPVESVARTALRSWGFPAVNLNVTKRTFYLHELMRVIDDYEGTHTFTMTIADEADRKSTFVLAIEVSAGGPDPGIEWVDHKIKKRYNTADLQADGSVKIRVTASQGVKSLLVKITGSLVETLDSVEIPAEFDLVDPEATKEGLSTKLEGLGFPVGADVVGKTKLEFDITNFMPMMATSAGRTDFRLKVIDGEGTEIHEKVRVFVGPAGGENDGEEDDEW